MSAAVRWPAEVHDVHTGEDHRGKEWASIVRRVWGRRAELRNVHQLDRELWEAEVTKPAAYPGAHHVLGRVTLRGGPDA